MAKYAINEWVSIESCNGLSRVEHQATTSPNDDIVS